MFSYCRSWGSEIVDPHDLVDVATKVYLAKAKEAVEPENTNNQFLLLLLDSKIEKKEVVFSRNKNLFDRLPIYQKLNISEPVVKSLLSVFEMILSEESILLNNNERQKFFSNLIEEIGKEQLSFSEQRLMRRISVYFNQLTDTTSFGLKK